MTDRPAAMRVRAARTQRAKLVRARDRNLGRAEDSERMEDPPAGEAF